MKFMRHHEIALSLVFLAMIKYDYDTVSARK